jgi:hypothetical protein
MIKNVINSAIVYQGADMAKNCAYIQDKIKNYPYLNGGWSCVIVS